MNHQEEFRADVIEGLSRSLKRLSSKYFYDANGDKIFQEIMQLEEYYLPNVELEILQQRTEAIMEDFPCNAFNVVELGAGDGSKTIHFLQQLVALGKEIVYVPLDISPDVLRTNSSLMQSNIPELNVKPIPGDYFKTLSSVDANAPKIILFLGSNIGNYENEAAINFLQKVKQSMRPGDQLLVGIDLKKNPKIILQAYNDTKGVTKRFNLNLLERINRELDANFDLDAFDHYPSYDPISGMTYSFIVSLKNQLVEIAGHPIQFEEGEVIHTEVSQKYGLDQINTLKEQAGFLEVQHFLDNRGYFSVSAFKV